jgi:hypothetical protein
VCWGWSPPPPPPPPHAPALFYSWLLAGVPGFAQLLQTWNSESWPAGQPVLAVKLART